MSSIEGGKERLQIIEEVPSSSDILYGTAKEIISRLQELEDKYPGCHIEWYYEEYWFVYNRPENDKEYSTRMAAVRSKEDKKRKKELELLAKLKAEYEG